MAAADVLGCLLVQETAASRSKAVLYPERDECIAFLQSACDQLVDRSSHGALVCDVAIDFVDQCTRSSHAVRHRAWRDVARACLFVAIKMNYHYVPEAREVMDVLGDPFGGSTREFFAVEGAVIEALAWRLNPPAVALFVSLLGRDDPRATTAALRVWRTVRARSMPHYRPSVQAVALLVHAGAMRATPLCAQIGSTAGNVTACARILGLTDAVLTATRPKRPRDDRPAG